MKTVLVTGGAGFIGSHITDELIKRKYKAIVLDNLSAGKKEFINSNATFERADITKPDQLEKVFKKYKFDAVLHLAGQPSIVNSFSDPLNDAMTNFVGTINIVSACMKHNVPRLIYASSMTVYGNQKNPLKETSPCVPINNYGIAKYASERYVHVTSQRKDLKMKLNITSLRMFNVFGPRQSLTNPYQGVLAIFMGNVLRNEPIKIFGTGNQGRDFVYVKDVAKLWVDTIGNKKSYGNIYNIGSSKETSILKLAKTVIRACGRDPKTYKIIFKPSRSGDQQHVKPDISKAIADLNFKPEIGLLEGMTQTLKFWT